MSPPHDKIRNFKMLLSGSNFLGRTQALEDRLWFLNLGFELGLFNLGFDLGLLFLGFELGVLHLGF